MTNTPEDRCDVRRGCMRVITPQASGGRLWRVRRLGGVPMVPLCWVPFGTLDDRDGVPPVPQTAM